jgi:hypothetical protein
MNIQFAEADVAILTVVRLKFASGDMKFLVALNGTPVTLTGKEDLGKTMNAIVAKNFTFEVSS